MTTVRILTVLLMLVSIAHSQNPGDAKIKFYDFDDLLIDGKIQKPQILYTDAKQKVKFGKLLKLKRDFLIKLKNTEKDPTFR